eukprot:3046420-Pleurochrysis_carterae.AAC.1
MHIRSVQASEGSFSFAPCRQATDGRALTACKQAMVAARGGAPAAAPRPPSLAAAARATA